MEGEAVVQNSRNFLRWSIFIVTAEEVWVAKWLYLTSYISS